ncbi:MAG: hypothetical protein E7013_04680 [Alphaproteobacteria bacterium]|nr:hypothetical protein [Alphaproteobacteria bacterium]
MKKIAIFIFIISLSVYAKEYRLEETTACQKNLVCDKNGKLITGMVKHYYKNGILNTETPYKEGKKDGIEKWYDKAANLWHTISYKGGEKDGFEKYYDKNGNLLAENHFFKGSPADGVLRIYLSDGTLGIERTYKNGEKNGIEKMYTSGYLEFENFYKNNRLDGPQRQYDEKGNLLFENIYKDGKPVDGIHKLSIGGTTVEEEYKNGEISKRNISGNGSVESQFYYEKDQTIEKEYYDDGSLKMKRRYKNVPEDGTEKSYDQKGRLIQERTKKSDIRYSYSNKGIKKTEKLYGTASNNKKTYREDGTLEKELLFTEEGQKQKHYYPDGKTVFLEMLVKKDFNRPYHGKSGKLKLFHGNGYYKIYEKNGKLKFEIQIEDIVDESKNIVYKYDENGQKEQITTKNKGGLALLEELLKSMDN